MSGRGHRPLCITADRVCAPDWEGLSWRQVPKDHAACKKEHHVAVHLGVRLLHYVSRSIAWCERCRSASDGRTEVRKARESVLRMTLPAQKGK